MRVRRARNGMVGCLELAKRHTRRIDTVDEFDQGSKNSIMNSRVRSHIKFNAKSYCRRERAN